MFWTALVAVVVLYTIKWYYKTRDYREKISKLKSEPGLPLLGHVFKVGTKPGEILGILERMWNNQGRDKFLLKIGPIDQVIITNPVDVEVLLTSNVLHQKSVIYYVFKAWLGQGLVTSSGSHWRIHRKIISPAFHFKVIESYVELYKQDANILLGKLLRRNLEEIDITDLVDSGVTSSISCSALGIHFSSKEDLATFKDCSKRLERVMSDQMFSAWKQLNPLYKLSNEHKEFLRDLNTVQEIVQRTCEKKKEELKDVIEAISSGKTTIEEITTGDNEFTKRKLTFMEILLLSRKPNGEPLSPQEIDDEVNTFLFAGFETVKSNVLFTMYALAKHPDIQDKVYQEQLEITNGDLTQPITYADLQNMKYLDRVIKESLRIYVPGPLFGRYISQNTMLKDGTELPVGCSVLFVPYLTHRHPDMFEEPMKFNPDRFLKPIQNYSYYPFGAGPRNCIGQKVALTLIKTWLATITRSCIIHPSKTKDIQSIFSVTLTSANGFHLRFEKR